MRMLDPLQAQKSVEKCRKLFNIPAQLPSRSNMESTKTEKTAVSFSELLAFHVVLEERKVYSSVGVFPAGL